MIDTPVSASPAMIARSIGAAPRQRGSSDGWTFTSSNALSSGSFNIAPNAQTMTTSGAASAIRATASGALTSSGWNRSRPSARATSATGGAVSFRPRPAGRSGRVTTRTGRCGVSARRSRTRAANSEVPR